MNKSELSKKLADTLAYYVNDPKKRCINERGDCTYSGKTAKRKTKGCFVGSLMTPKQRLLADEITGDVYYIIGRASEVGLELPEIITNNDDLMDAFQTLHDNNSYWCDNGLSNNGKNKLLYTIDKYNLIKKYFKPFLG